MTELQLALAIFATVIGAVVAVGLLAQRFLEKARPSSEAIKRVSWVEALTWIALCVLGLIVYEFGPLKGTLGEFLKSWYGWPVAIAVLLAAVYVVTFIYTFVRLLVKRRRQDHGA